MSILSQADKLNRNEQKRRREARRPRKQMDKIVSLQRRVWKLFRSELHNKRGFIVERPEGDIFGEAAVLRRKSEFEGQEPDYIGTASVASQNYKWRGSDESPEQDMQATHIFFAQIVNAGERYVDVVVGDGYPVEPEIEKAIQKFKSGMAKFISQEL